MAKLPSHADLGLPTPPRGGRWRPAPTPLQERMEKHNRQHAARMRAILANKPRPPLPVYSPPWLLSSPRGKT
jgi:hypothetical protein